MDEYLKNILPAEFFREVRFNYQLAEIISGKTLNGKVPRIDPNGKEIGYTDLYLNKNYRGQFIGSGRHVITGNEVVKGAGLSLVENLKLSHHNSGQLTKEEAVREFVIAESLSNTNFTVKYNAIGRYDETSFFIVRNADIPRIAQIEIDKLKPEHVENLKALLGARSGRDLMNKVIANLVMPFNLNFSHHSLNVHNVNLLGQYLDLTSMRSFQHFSYLSFWENGSQLDRLKEVILSMLEIADRLYGGELKFQQVLDEQNVPGAGGIVLHALKMRSAKDQIAYLERAGRVQRDGNITHYLLDTGFTQNIEISLKIFQKELNMDMSKFSEFLQEIRKV